MKRVGRIVDEHQILDLDEGVFEMEPGHEHVGAGHVDLIGPVEWRVDRRDRPVAAVGVEQAAEQ